MGRHLIVITRCPLCGENVEQVPDGVLKAHPEKYDAEMIVTRTGLKQYLHSSCWYKMNYAKYQINKSAYAKGCNDVLDYYIKKLEEIANEQNG